jgi:formiminotetrahydrofolate cyclodeaminase
VALQVDEVLDAVASGDPLPGAGVVATFTAAAAAALTASSARRAVGDWPEAGAAIAQAEALRRRCVELASRSEAAYTLALAALHSADRDAIGATLPATADTLLDVAEAAADVAVVAAATATGCANAATPDAQAAAALAHGAAVAVTALLGANLLVTPDDPRRARAQRAVALAAEAERS